MFGSSWKKNDRGSLNLEQALTIALLVLVAAGTLFMLGNAIMCMYANQTAEIGGQEYPGRCVDIRHLAAEDNGDGTVTLTWVGGEAPFVVSRSDTELVAFKAPDDPFLGVAYAATEVVPDLDGNDYDRVATVEAGYGQTWYQVNEVGGDAVVADLVGPEAPQIAALPLIAVSAGGLHTVGLRSDGTVVATGLNEFGQCDVASWTGITAVSASGLHTVGLRQDGTVVAVGDNYYGQCDVASWTGITAVSAGPMHTVGLRSDGTVVAAGRLNYWGPVVGSLLVSDMASWTGITAVSSDLDHTVGLRSDGTVVAAGINDWGQCDVASWTGITAVSAGGSYTVGLRSDGSVVVVGNNAHGQCDVASWTGITAVSAGGICTVGLRSDGTVVAVGNNELGQCDVASWTDITAVSASGWHTVGLRQDGTVVAVGDNELGQCDVGSW